MNEKTMAKPTTAELEILNFIWQNGPSTVRSINDKLNGEKKVGYTTTLKIMQIMAEKGLLKRDERQRSHLYAAAAPEKQVQKVLLDRLLDQAFGGSALKLVMQALGAHIASAEEISRIRELLDRLEGGQK
ncbi:MAG TPA: BlaI/MecI/CopY family transcriptional regulator [Patescibacteria group bacterium]|nr:BlaI/MecI/CopY family transcriptional regulator [Patescibacteria group bacterium]